MGGGVAIVFVRQDAADSVAEKLASSGRIRINLQPFVMYLNAEKPELCGLLWCINCRGNLNCVRNGLILRSIFYLMVSLEYRLEYHRYWVDGVGGS